MEERARIPPGLPRENPSVSYWQQPPADIADLQTTPDLPPYADYVIVGAGISGVSIAYNLLRRQPAASVVLLEARQAVSGATGRNGGHTKAASYRSFLAHEKRHGTAEAVKIALLEHANIQSTHAFAREHNIDCASTPCDTVDILYSTTQLEAGKQAITRMAETLEPDHPAAEYHFWSSADAHAKFYSPGAVGAISYPAGSISAYAFTVGVLRLALEKGLNLQTHTAVTSIHPTGDAQTHPVGPAGTAPGSPRSEEARWTALTPRGPVAAANLILATNGHTAHLLPRMQGLIVPLHGQVAALRPGDRLPGGGSLPTTYSYIRDEGYEYMITRPRGSAHAGDVVIGGGIWRLPGDGASRFGETDDAALEPTITDFLRGSVGDYFGEFWGRDHPEGRVRKEWSGVMGATADGLPYVGAVPDEGDRGGLWICAGFNGHGMVWCWKSAEAMVEMMTGDADAKRAADAWFPQPAIISPQRLKAKFTGGDWQAPGEAQFGGRN